MRKQSMLAAILTLLAVPVGIALIVFGVVESKPSGVAGGRPAGVAGVDRTPTPGKGEANMLDPQGDMDVAEKVLSWAAYSGPVQIILSRKVQGGELSCLGFEGFGSLNQRAADTFGLVVLGGDLIENVPMLQVGGGPVPYIAYLYDLKYVSVTAQGSAAWPMLRANFGGSGWPQDNPMYVSPDGQPGLGEIDPLSHPMPGVWHGIAQDVNVSKEISGWRVTVRRLYIQQRGLIVMYTVTGPRQHYRVDDPSLIVAGEAKIVSVTSRTEETMGPSVNVANSYALPAVTQPQKVPVQFTVPAIHVRPTRFPCETPGETPEQKAVEDNSTATAVSDRALLGGAPTPLPDLQTIGPFTLDFELRVDPEPTHPPQPSPVPTNPDLAPLPVATGQP